MRKLSYLILSKKIYQSVYEFPSLVSTSVPELFFGVTNIWRDIESKTILCLQKRFYNVEY